MDLQSDWEFQGKLAINISFCECLLIAYHGPLH